MAPASLVTAKGLAVLKQPFLNMAFCGLGKRLCASRRHDVPKQQSMESDSVTILFINKRGRYLKNDAEKPKRAFPYMKCLHKGTKKRFEA